MDLLVQKEELDCEVAFTTFVEEALVLLVSDCILNQAPLRREMTIESFECRRSFL